MPGGDGHTRRLRALNEQIARIDVVRHPRTMNTTETCICLPGISGWNPECPAHELFAPPTDVEHEWTNSPGRWSDAPGGAPGVPIDECTDDHSNGEHCAIHGYDDSVSAPWIPLASRSPARRTDLLGAREDRGVKKNIVRTAESGLWGKTVITTAGIEVTFAPHDEDGGDAGVREPRRPKPAAPAASVAVAR